MSHFGLKAKRTDNGTVSFRKLEGRLPQLWFNYNQTFHCVKASMSSSSWTKVCVTILISLSCCLPEQLVSQVFKTCSFNKIMERLRKCLSFKMYILLKVGFIRMLNLSTASVLNLITLLIVISQGYTFLTQMLHLGKYILDSRF